MPLMGPSEGKSLETDAVLLNRLKAIKYPLRQKLGLGRRYPMSPHAFIDLIGPKTLRSEPRKKEKIPLGNFYIYHLPSQDRKSDL